MCYKCNFLKPISLLSLAHRRTPNHSSQEQISLNEEMNTQQMIDRKERQPGTCCNNTAHDSVFYLKIIKSNMHAMKHAQKKNESLFHYSFHFSLLFTHISTVLTGGYVTLSLFLLQGGQLLLSSAYALHICVLSA